MRKLIFIRHSESQILPADPPASWPLTDEGKARCIPLAQELATFNMQRIFSSEEMKAVETGRIIAGLLNIPCQTAPGLQEHEYRGPFLSREAFLAGVAHLFSEPDRPVFGQSAHETLARFQEAVTGICERYPSGNLGIVTHGRLLAFYLAAHTGEPAFSIWQTLKMPDYRIVTLNESLP